MAKQAASQANSPAPSTGPVSRSVNLGNSSRHRELLTRFDPKAIGFGIVTPWVASGKAVEETEAAGSADTDNNQEK